jgi:hypothetical protein
MPRHAGPRKQYVRAHTRQQKILAEKIVSNLALPVAPARTLHKITGVVDIGPASDLQQRFKQLFGRPSPHQWLRGINAWSHWDPGSPAAANLYNHTGQTNYKPQIRIQGN